MTIKMPNEWDFPDADFVDFIRAREAQRMVFAFRSPQLMWRPHFVNFVVAMRKTFDLSANTAHLAVHLLDVFMDNHDIDLDRLYLVASTCVRVVCKLEERKILKIGCTAHDDLYPRHEHRIAELMLLTLLNWDINVPTAGSACLHFMEHMPTEPQRKGGDAMTAAIKATAITFLELSLFDVTVQHTIAPSKLGAMCLGAARLELGIKPVWNTDLAALTQYAWTDLHDDIVGKLLPIQKPLASKLRHELTQLFSAANTSSAPKHANAS